MMAASAAISVGASVVSEHIEAGRIEQIDFGLLPLDGGDGGGNRQLAVDFLFVVIGDGVAFIDARQAVASRPPQKGARPLRRSSRSGRDLQCQRF